MFSISLCIVCWVTGFIVPSAHIHIVYINYIYPLYYCVLFPKPPFFLPNNPFSFVMYLFFSRHRFQMSVIFLQLWLKKKTERRKDFLLFTVWSHGPPWQRRHSSVRRLRPLAPLYPQSESRRCQMLPNCSQLHFPVSLAVITNIEDNLTYVERDNLNWRFASISSVCESVCDSLSWLLINMGIPKSLLAAPSPGGQVSDV